MIAAFLAGSAATAAYGIYSKKAKEEDGAAAESTARGLGAIVAGTNRSMNVRSAVGSSTNQREGFLSDILEQLWSYINVAASQTIKESVEPEFKTLPGPLSTLHFIKVDLGDVPIRLDNIVVHDIDKATNTLQMDLDVQWDGNCNIQLKANYVSKEYHRVAVQRIFDCLSCSGRLAVGIFWCQVNQTVWSHVDPHEASGKDSFACPGCASVLYQSAKN